MKLLFLNWRDRKNPRSGGAEVVTEEVLKRLSARGHECVLFTTAFPGGAREENVDGYRVIRRGNERLGVHAWAFFLWFRRFRKERFDMVVDQIHGIPFFTPLYIRAPRVVALIHEVAREIWLRMYPFPIGRIGYILEPYFFRPYRNIPVITVSEATKRDLISMNIPSSHISLIPEAITATPLDRAPKKDPVPTIIFVGRIAKMKGVHHLLEAYAIAKKQIPALQLWLVGGGDTYKSELEARYKHDPDITFFGFVSEETKLELLERATILASASMKEGYGLVVIEAGACGTPSVVYNVDGFNEAVIHNQTGLLTAPNPPALAAGIVSLLGTWNVERGTLYSSFQSSALARSREFTFDRTTDVFEKILTRNVF